jgi:hypothetical protein
MYLTRLRNKVNAYLTHPFLSPLLGLQSNEPRDNSIFHHALRLYSSGQLFYSFFFNPKSLQQPLKNRTYFEKVYPWSQIRDSGAILQCADNHMINILGQKMKPEIRSNSSLFGLQLTVRCIACNG